MNITSGISATAAGTTIPGIATTIGVHPPHVGAPLIMVHTMIGGEIHGAIHTSQRVGLVPSVFIMAIPGTMGMAPTIGTLITIPTVMVPGARITAIIGAEVIGVDIPAAWL